MLVSLDKNLWLYKWMDETWADEFAQILQESFINRHVKLSILLNDKGYQAHLTSKRDIILVMKEKEYIFLKLKYS